MSSSNSFSKASTLSTKFWSNECLTTATPNSAHSGYPAKNVTKNIQQVSPDKGLCVITLVRQEASVCRFLAENSDIQLIGQLEFAWGVKPGTLDVDNARNVIFLTTNLLASFKQGNWALVPSMETIREIGRQTTVDGVSDFDSQREYEYEFVYFKGTVGEIVQRNPKTGQLITIHPPYKELPLIRLHLHPCFVMCDAGQKHIQHKPSLEGELRHRVAVCRGLYERWLSAKPWVMPSAPSSSSSELSTQLSLSLSRSNLPSVSCVVSRPGVDVGPKRKRNNDGEPTDLENGPDPKRRRQITADSIGELGTTRWGLEGWAEDVATCGSPENASALGDSSAQIALESYRNEDIS